MLTHGPVGLCFFACVLPCVDQEDLVSLWEGNMYTRAMGLYLSLALWVPGVSGCVIPVFLNSVLSLSYAHTHEWVCLRMCFP
jgi:hypothetical protein